MVESFSEYRAMVDAAHRQWVERVGRCCVCGRAVDTDSRFYRWANMAACWDCHSNRYYEVQAKLDGTSVAEAERKEAEYRILDRLFPHDD
jgi:hypothetical protein